MAVTAACLMGKVTAIEPFLQPEALIRRPVAFLIEHYEDNWLASYDPTLLSNRLLSEFSWENRNGGDSVLKWENTLRLALPIREDLTAGVQVMAPMVSLERGTADDLGFGDLEARVGIVRRIVHGFRCGVGLNTAFDTASEPSLGAGVFELRPLLVFRWDVAKHLQLGLNGEYSFTPKDEGEDEVSALETKLQVALKLNKAWSSAVTYKPRWDFLADDMRHRIEAGLTRVWGRNEQHAFSISAEMPLSSQSLDWKLITGYSWHF